MSDLGNRKVFADNLMKYMHKAAISRKQLSNDLNISYSTLCEWLSAKKYPRIDKIELLANYFNTTKAHLIENGKDIENREYLVLLLWGEDADKVTSGMVEDVKEYADYILKKTLKESEESEK